MEVFEEDITLKELVEIFKNSDLFKNKRPDFRKYILDKYDNASVEDVVYNVKGKTSNEVNGIVKEIFNDWILEWYSSKRNLFVD